MCYYFFNPVEESKSPEITAAKTDEEIGTVKSAAKVGKLDDKLVEAAVSLNNSTSNDVNKTTTTVTVNVTQTRVVTVSGGDDIDKGDVVVKAHQSTGDVVSTVSSIACDAAVGTIEKVAAAAAAPPPKEHEIKKPVSADVTTNSIAGADDDIEMTDADAVMDCEMEDVPPEELPQTLVSTTTSTTAKTAQVGVKIFEADSVKRNTTATEASATNSEAEQKIDDVEKNISNLFNGDDNVVESTNDGKSCDDLSKTEHFASAASLQSGSGSINTGNNLLKNGNAVGDKVAQPHDTINDNNDLVSILAGSDSKPEDKISSCNANRATEAKKSEAQNVTLLKIICELNSIENKQAKGISPNGSQTNTQSNKNVTNAECSPSIQKQCQISLGNSAEIDAISGDQGLGGKASRQEIISSHSSTVDNESGNNCDVKSTSTVPGWF